MGFHNRSWAWAGHAKVDNGPGESSIRTFGHPWIYPVVDWTHPKPTSVVLVLTALSLALAHVVVVAVAAVRDALAARCRRNDDIIIDEVYLERDSDDAVV
ncbi:hypothetical protein EVAR_21151_1 [Eumeta japonica]|uniref:Uncharacterized protein n=1 Tax=Eumeta variegata TaxID=151549 RepID=A0A4C1VSM6_EUMVA|nr:hypothetical protein EVAR_21151_1 [Eumeta japonica]